MFHCKYTFRYSCKLLQLKTRRCRIFMAHTNNHSFHLKVHQCKAHIYIHAYIHRFIYKYIHIYTHTYIFVLDHAYTNQLTCIKFAKSWNCFQISIYIQMYSAVPHPDVFWRFLNRMGAKVPIFFSSIFYVKTK